MLCDGFVTDDTYIECSITASKENSAAFFLSLLFSVHNMFSVQMVSGDYKQRAFNAACMFTKEVGLQWKV